MVKKSRGGFSLIELMIVVGLIVLLFSLVGSQASFFNRMVVRAEFEKLHTVCLYLQRRALTREKIQELKIKPDGYQYDDVEQKLPAVVLFGLMPGVLGPPSLPTHTPKNPITFAAHTVQFLPDGQIKPGTIYLTDKHRQFQYALSCGVGGAACVNGYQYDGKWHLLF